MPKTNSFNLFAPFVSTKTTGKNIFAVSWKASKEAPVRSSSAGNFVPKAALGAVIILTGMLALHLYSVNTYSDKGFALSEVQGSIKEQTDLQKKLLVQQSLLNSRAGLTDNANNGLVTITDQEYLSPTNFAAAQ